MTPDPAPPAVPVETLLAQREWVRRLARSLVADEDRADDLEQQTWLAALEHPPAHDRSIRGWLGTVLRRAASKGRRSERRRGRRERAAATLEPEPPAAEVVAQAELHARVVRAVLDLEEPYRTTMLLRYFDRLPPRRIAARMGVPVETVSSRVQRALARLRARFDREHGGDRRSWAGAMASLFAPRPSGAPRALPLLAKAIAGAALVTLASGGTWLVLSRLGARRSEVAPAAAGTTASDARESAASGGSGPGGEALAAPSGARPGVRPAAARIAGASLAGSVRRDQAGGTAVAGARVQASRTFRHPGTRDTWETVTDAEGRYAFDGLPPGEVMVVASAPGLTTMGLAGASAEGFNPLAVTVARGATANLDLVLVPGGLAAGRVVDAEGKAVPGATVRARAPPPARSSGFLGSVALPPWTVTTGADGDFRFDALPPGVAYEFEAEARDQHPARSGPIAVPGPEAASVEIRLPASRWIEVQVVDDESGSPVEGAGVTAMEKAGPRTVSAPEGWTTGADGRARIGPFLLDEVLVSAEGPADATGRGRGASARVPVAETSCVLRLVRSRGPSETEARADLEARGTKVHVVGPGGRPVPFAQAMSYRWERGGGGFRAGAVREGFVNLGYGEPPSAFVEVFDARDGDGAVLGYGAARVPLGTSREITVRLDPERTISGTVLDPRGVGVGGVLVLARPTWWPEGPTPFSALAHATARTDAGGRFRLLGLADTEYRLVLRLPPGLVADAVGPTPAGTEGVVVRTRASVAATLTIVDAAGVPVAGARVGLLPAGTDPRHRERLASFLDLPPLATSDARGVVRLGPADPAATYALAVDPPPERAELRPLLRDAWSPGDETLTLEAGRVVRGHVRDPAGRVVDGVEVLWTTARGGGHSVPTAADGSFVLRDVAAGEVILVPHFPEHPASAHSRQARVVPAGTLEVDLVFDPGLPLVVRVENAPPGPLRAALIAEGGARDAAAGERGGARGARGRDERALAPSTALDGVLRFRGLAADATYTLYVSPVVGLSLVHPGIRSEDGEVRLRLEPGLEITGRILVPQGATDVRVGFNDGRISGSGTVDADGRYVIAGLPEGSYEIRAWAHSGDEELTGSVTVRAGARADIELRPRPKGGAR